jgi:hypothetical protein
MQTSPHHSPARAGSTSRPAIRPRNGQGGFAPRYKIIKLETTQHAAALLAEQGSAAAVAWLISQGEHPANARLLVQLLSPAA